MTELTTRLHINHLVAAFYQQAMQDELIGHFFTEVVAINLEEHLPVICDFWESVLLGTGVYRGNPMLKHLELDDKSPLQPTHMNRWLALWEATIRANYYGEKADLAIRRSQDIGRLMLFKISRNK